MTRLTDKKLYLFVTTELDGQERKFFTVEAAGDEQISGLFHYRLTLKTADNQVDFSQIVGKPMTVSIQQFGGTIRYINGVVARFIQAEDDGRFTTYYAELRPWLWELTLTSDSRIFQGQSVIDIVTGLFSEFGYTDFEDRTTGTYSPKDYCVQYQETAFNFISRLLEDEGIFYFFEHTDGVHTLVLADDADAHPVCPGLTAAKLRKVEPEADELVDRCSFQQEMIPNQYALEDFNFETPDTDLLTQVDGPVSGSLRIYEYPGKFANTGDGETLANRRIEGIEVSQRRLIGEGFCRAFAAGHTFTLEGHDRADLNRSYVLRRLSILATVDRYTNRFEAFPDDVVFRPPRTARKPRITGTQTAVVAGKSGEEIWPDTYGRIKVRFHWDQEGSGDENSSCWIRVAQVWAGKSWGTLFVPRIGMEVVVSFLEGDPDRPVIIGTVYNANQTVPYPLADKKNVSTIQSRSTKSGSAGNELRFDDTIDAEELYFHAQKDHTVSVENDRACDILNDDTLTVKNNRETTVQEGDETLTVGQGKRTVDVAGNETHENGANFTQNVTGNYKLKVTGNVNIEAGGIVTVKGSMIKLN